jgi:transcriptional regulator with XRE-family HTH domain
MAESSMIPAPSDRLHPLEQIRRSLGMSREQLAAQAGVSIGTILGIERRGVRPQRATQAVLSMTLHVMPEVLFPAPNEGLDA